MVKVAILGFGVVGSGVAEVLSGNGAGIQKKADELIEVKYILDVRDFPDSPFAKHFVKDFSVIEHDPEVNVVVETIGGVRIMFSPAGQSADKVIEKLAHDARERMVETLVVTSDATIQDTVFGGGVDRMSANGFSYEVGEYYDQARLDESPKVAEKRPLGDRIPADTLAKLKAMRDGKL